MASIPDLVRDSKLETYYLPDCTVETVHSYHEPEQKSRRRLVTKVEHWKRQKRVGKGAYGNVWLEECTQGARSGRKVRAVKQIDINGGLGAIDYNRELEAIAKFSQPRYERCFIKSLGWYDSPEYLLIAMEYLENILIQSHKPDEWLIKISDFGISKRIEEATGVSTALRGTLGCIVPELYDFTKCDTPFASDIWALGQIVCGLLTKAMAFAHVESLFSYDRMMATMAISHAWIHSKLSPSPYTRDPSTVTSLTERFASWFTPPSSLARQSTKPPSPAPETPSNNTGSHGVDIRLGRTVVPVYNVTLSQVAFHPGGHSVFVPDGTQ
ncbi:Tetratricopeptide-like helical [Penicillium fimorum]|uniref:Tetratricopeptide-like helical n=1 Tax=Penicillium fimorum TaxID=1882269 RepID=A0A9W9XXQ5_9EURO|nr:Tetratricopeptide-like helical [Penicillium fimorum]